MDYPKQPHGVTQKEQKILDLFAEHAFPPVETTADDLVSVKMTSRFELIEVRVWRKAAQARGMEALDQAILKAVNAAIREVAERNGRRLSEYAENLPKE